jgi:DNA topoisomerase VI subunit A
VCKSLRFVPSTHISFLLVVSRMFLARITNELKIPVLGLVDSDPYGLKILSVYMVSCLSIFRSKNTD